MGVQRLYVFVHGLHGSPATFDRLWALVLSRDPTALRYFPSNNLNLLATCRADELATALAEEIETACARHLQDDRPIDEVVLLGHSAGATLARAAWLGAMGVLPDSAIAAEPAMAWAGKVRRIVLVAALAAGWRANVAMSPGFRIGLWIAGAADYVPFLRFFIFDLRRGSAFMTGLRLRSMALSRAGKYVMPLVVQLVGTVDDLVAPADHIDLVTGGDFLYLEVEGAGHTDIVDAAIPRHGDALEAALFDSREALTALPYAVPPADMADLYSVAADDFDEVAETPSADARTKVDHAVMVIHGIRDYGFWTKRLAGRIKTLARTGGPDRAPVTCRTVTSSYGFFPMAPFVFKPPRRLRVEWFMDQFVQTRARYPGAKISFVGHSNGTYLLAEALRTCPAITIDAVVFAGSVVRSDYDWAEMKRAGRIRGGMVNYVATSDWVVAFFPLFLGRLGFDLGGGGHDGFDDDRDARNLRFAPGQHDAGIRDRQWDGIARFILYGEDPESIIAPGLWATHRKTWWLRLGSWTVVPAAVIVVGWLATLTWNLIMPLTSAQAWGLGAAIALFLGLRTLLTRL